MSVSKLKIVFFLFLALCLAAPSILVAEAGPDVSVAFVDFKKAVWGNKVGLKAEKNLKTKYTSAQKTINSQTKDLDKLKSKLQSQRDSLKITSLLEKEEELLAKEKKLKRHFVDSKEDLRREESKVRASLVQGIRKIIAQIGKENGYTVILEKGGNSVLYADSGIDITDEVIKRYDAAH